MLALQIEVNSLLCFFPSLIQLYGPICFSLSNVLFSDNVDDYFLLVVDRKSRNRIKNAKYLR